MRRTLKLGFLLVVLGSAACAGSAAREGRAVNQNELTQQQIRDSGGTDALEVIQRLRPLWLRTRSQSSINAPNTILVYLNDTRLGGLDALRGYPLEGIVKMMYLNASEATNKLAGTGSMVVDGAIILSTRQN